MSFTYPDTVFSLHRGGRFSIGSGGGGLDRDALLAVHRLSRGKVLGDKQVFLTTAGDKNTGMTVRLDDDLLTTLDTFLASLLLTTTSTTAAAARGTTTTAFSAKSACRPESKIESASLSWEHTPLTCQESIATARTRLSRTDLDIQAVATEPERTTKAKLCCSEWDTNLSHHLDHHVEVLLRGLHGRHRRRPGV